MADRVFCIDFGSAFTKVGLRRDPGAEAETADQFCPGPRRRRGFLLAISGGDRSQFGKADNRVRVRRPSTQKRERSKNSYQNWKKWVFNEPGPAVESSAPLDTLLHSEDFRQLADRLWCQPARFSSYSSW